MKTEQITHKQARWLVSLRNSDFQERGSDYPSANIPDMIKTISYPEMDRLIISFVFKNTSEENGETWVNNFFKEYEQAADITQDHYFLDTNQSGDYENDWIDVDAIFYYVRD